MANVKELDDNKKYESTCEIMYFCRKGQRFTGKFIKDNLPFELSPHQSMDNFFKEIK